MLLKLSRLLLDPEFNVNFDNVNEIAQYDCIFQRIRSSFLKNQTRFKKLSKLIDMIDVCGLIRGDLIIIQIYSFFIFKIGIFGYNSSLSISIISSLNDQDQSQLKSIMYNLDEELLYAKSLLLNQKLLHLESENSNLLKLINLVNKNQKHIEVHNDININELNEMMELKSVENDSLKHKLSNATKLNKSLEQQVAQLNKDLEDLQKLMTTTEKQPNQQNKPIVNELEVTKEYSISELFKFEYNLLNEWILHMNLSQSQN